MAYRRKTGERNIVPFAKVSGTAIAEGDLVMKNGTSKNVTVWTTSSAVLGVACEAGASASTSAIDVDVFLTPPVLESDVDSGTPASGDIISCDGDKDGLAVGTNTNHDFLYWYNGTTGTAYCVPKKLEVAQQTT